MDEKVPSQTPLKPRGRLVCSRTAAAGVAGQRVQLSCSHHAPPVFDRAQERSRAAAAASAAGLTRRQLVLDGASGAARTDMARSDHAAPLRHRYRGTEHRPGSTEAADRAEGYRLLQQLLGEGPLASLALWCYRRRHGVPAEAILTVRRTPREG